MPQQWGLDRQPDGWAPSQVRSDDWEPKSEPGPCADTTDLIRCLVGECSKVEGTAMLSALLVLFGPQLSSARRLQSCRRVLAKSSTIVLRKVAQIAKSTSGRDRGDSRFRPRMHEHFLCVLQANLPYEDHWRNAAAPLE